MSTTGWKAFSVLSGIAAIIMVSCITVHSFIHLFKNSNVDLYTRFCALAMFMCSVLWGIIGTILYSTITNAATDCNWMKYLSVPPYAFTRMFYYLFLTYRLEVSFRHSAFAISKSFIRTFRTIIVCATIGIAIWNMVSSEVRSYYDWPIWGTYCEYGYPTSLLVVYGIYDLCVSVICLGLYVYKLLALIKKTTEFMDSDPDILPMVRFHTVLAAISVISTWIVMIGGNSIFRPLRYFVALDGFLNALCIYLMFEFVHFRKRWNIARDQYHLFACICWCWCCWGLNSICWTSEVRKSMNNLSHAIMTSEITLEKLENVESAGTPTQETETQTQI